MRAVLQTGSIAALLLVAGCSDDKLSGNTGGGTTTTETTGTTGGGGATGTAGSGGQTTGGAGGTTGSGGMTSSGGTGGTTSSGGTGGTGGTGGMTSTGGSGGIGGAGGGGGGSGGAAPTGTLLVLAGGVPASLGQAATWSGAAGWGISSINLQFKDVALVPEGTGALTVARRLANNPPMGDDELFWAKWTPGAGFGAVTSLNKFAADGPALAPHGVARMLAVLDTQNKHVFAQFEAGAFGPFGAVPAGMPGSQAFGPSGPALAAAGAASLYLAYAGDDSQLYISSKDGPGSVWTPSSKAPTAPIVNTVPPSLFVDTDNDLHLFYVRQSDGRICTITLITPQNAWSAEEVVHQDAITGQSPSAVLLPGGDTVVAWHGFNNTGIYFSRRKAGVWSAPATVEIPAMSSSAPVVVTGLGGADAEILYTADAKLRWSRVTGNAAAFGPDPGVFNVTTLAALVLP